MADELRADIAAAKKQMRATIGAGREIKRLESYLLEGEIVERMTTGSYGKGTGLVVLTDRRLLFVQDGVMSKTTEDFPMSKISSVSFSSGLALGTLTVYASGNKAELGNISKHDGREISEVIRGRLSAGEAPAAAPAAASSPDPMAQLKQLGELRDAGVLSEEEFNAKKAELLGRL